MKLFHFTRRKALKKRNELLRARIQNREDREKLLKTSRNDHEYWRLSLEDDKLKLQINVLDEILN